MFKLSYQTESYASHQPILLEIAKSIFNGRIIEFGVGDYSTGLLHKICEKNNNVLYSIENDKDWLDKTKERYPGFHWHHYIHVQDYTDLLDINFDFSSDLTFIDGYTWGTRLFCLKETLSCKHKYIVVHDCNFLINEGSHGDYIKNTNYTVYDTLWPPTLVCSKKVKSELVIDYSKEEIE